MKKITGIIIGILFLTIPCVHAQTQDSKQIPKGELIKVHILDKEAGVKGKLFDQRKATERFIFEEDFETGAQGWEKEGTWEVGEPENGPGEGFNSVSVAGTNLTGNYPNNANEVLVTSLIELPDIPENRNISLRFREWFEIESGYDYGYLDISTDSGQSWTTLNSRDGYSEWRQTEVDLTSYAGEDIYLRFRLSSDNFISFSGWYIDDVTITEYALSPLNSEITSINSQNFPNIYANIRIDSSGVGFPDLTQDNFTVYENSTIQTNLFNVTPPQEGGGVRRADIIFLMDNSGSMSEEQDAVESNVFNFVDALAASNVDFSLGLVRYGANENSGDPIFEDNGSLTSDAGYFKNDVWLRNEIEGGDEPGYYAMTEAIGNASFRPGAQRIFIIITDETPNQGGASQVDAFEALEDGSTTLFALTESSLYHHFEPLTTVTGGGVFNIYSPFSDILDYIAEEVASSYVVSYRTDNPEYDGIPRTVRIEVNYEGNTSFDEVTYIPGAAPSIQRTEEMIALSDEGRPELVPLSIVAEITDDLSPGVQRAQLFYKNTLDSEGAYISVDMTNTSGNIYQADIPADAVVRPGMDYYITATDGNTTSSSPRTNPGATPFNIAVLPNEPPVIEHTPVTQASANQPIEIAFNATDQTRELERVRLHYRLSGQLNYEVKIFEDFISRSEFQYTIPAEFVTRDGVEYYIEAEDDWGVASTLPKEDVLNEPYSIEVNPAWPDLEGPAVVIQVNSPVKIGSVGFETDDGIFKKTKSREIENEVLNLQKESGAFEFREEFIFDKSDLFELLFSLSINSRTTEIRLFNEDESVIGHIPFKYTISDLENGEKIDAILYVHTEENLKPKLAEFPGWDYYVQDEYPVSMLIPPAKDYSTIDETRKPLLMVHGVSGEYPYWGSNMIDDLNSEYDTWQFYYPYDQQIEKSDSLLSKAIQELTTSVGLADYSTLENRVNVVAHSMGGLVTRSYIQSDHYQSNINKFLMLGTPNHGSYIAYRLFDEKIAGTAGWLVGKDKNAPAFKQMALGSKFIHKLNQTKPKKLFLERSIKESYLVIAGTEDFSIGLRHEEISNQDDGLVSVSSASLLAYSIPLATVDFSHVSTITQVINPRHLTTNTGEIILNFFHNNYNPNNDIQNLGKDITGFWLNSEDEPENGSPNGVDTGKGIIALRIPGSTMERIPIDRNFTAKILQGSECKSQLLLGKEKHTTISSSIPQIGPRYYLQNIDGTSNYFSLNTKGLNDLGFGFPQGCYRVKAFNITGSLNNGSFGEFDQTIEFKHLQTSMDTIYYSPGQLAISNSNSFISSHNSSSAKTSSNTLNSTRKVFTVDASVDSLTFWLSRFEGQDSNGLQLVSPSGSVIDSTIAKETSGMEFKQNQSAGFAFYYLENPEVGIWAVEYNENLDGAVLSAPVISDIDTEINFTSPDSAYVVGNEIEFNMTASLSSCNDPQATATLYNQKDNAPIGTIGDVPLISQNNGGGYEGEFTAEQSGVYYVESNFECKKDSETVRRKSIASIIVSGKEEILESQQGGVLLNQNYPNPFSRFTTITYSLPEKKHVTLTVYNILGRKITTLVDEEQESAKHYVTFNALNFDLASGMYIYTLTVDQKIETKKMIFVR